MPRTSTVPKESARRDKLGLELASHKAKIRNQKEEIDKLKRSIKSQNVLVARLEDMVAYLTRTAKSGGDDD
jgi:septal ring factor EnvC (AmiA/AmiB activator)